MLKESIMKLSKKAFAVFFIGILGAMFVLVLSGILIKGTHYIAREEKVWDASACYPFADDITKETADSIYTGVLHKVESLEDMLEKQTTSLFYFRMPFILVKKNCDRALGLDMTTSLCAGENNLQDSSDIVLPYEEDFLGFVMDDADISEKIERLLILGRQMQRDGRNFLFVLNPEKYKGNEIYPDYSEKKKEEVINAFEMSELDIICIPVATGETDATSLFFKTDHHWLPTAGICADEILCETLNQKYGYHFDTSVFYMDNYDIEIREKDFLGSQGKKITEVYCQKEDFPLILPRFETDLQVFISEKGKLSNGTIEETLLDYSVFENSNSYMRNDYAFYGYGDQELITIHNNNVHDGSNILIIKTSFADCMYPYLAAVVEDLSIIDLRYFNGSLQTFILDKNPDTVIVIYGLGIFENEEEAFDFR